MTVRRVLAAAALVAGVVTGTAGTAGVASATTSTVSLLGHGWGHGRGMGQFGALGYALDSGWSYHQILDHYYGGTTPGQAPAGTIMTVDMSQRDGASTIVAQEQGLLSLPAAAKVSCTSGAPCSVLIQRTGAGTWTVSQGTGCDGGAGRWKVTATGVGAAAVPVTATAGATDDRHQMLQLCEDDGTRWLRGDLWAVDTGTTQVTVDHLPLEGYVQGVVPNEESSSWGTLGGGAGEQALMAQAVAARSYSLAEHYSSYARSCDTTQCQVYAGRAFESNDGTYRDLEFASSDQAVRSTAGEIRLSSSGAVALTEFSSSSGGYTAGGAVPAVPDDGDSVSRNPNHTWTATLDTSSIEAAFGTGRGTLQSVEVTGRNGLGDLGGRVTTLTLVFSGGSVQTTGNAFAAALGLRSNWFTVTAQPTAATTPPATPPPPPKYHVLASNGSVFAFGGAPSYGSLSAAAAGTTAVGIGETPGGYDVLAGNGGVYTFGAASWFGSLRGKGLNAPPFQLATTPDGGGYWIVASDGGVFAFGDATFLGSTGGIRLNQPVVGMAPTADGHGYWLVARDGGVFSFGDAAFHGSTGGIHLNQPVVALAATPDGGGYWLIAADGGVFAFGDATYQGSLPGLGVQARAVALAATSGGYLVATSDGRVYGFGVPASGGPATAGSSAATVALAVSR